MGGSIVADKKSGKSTKKTMTCDPKLFGDNDIGKMTPKFHMCLRSEGREPEPKASCPSEPDYDPDYDPEYESDSESDSEYDAVKELASYAKSLAHHEMKKFLHLPNKMCYVGREDINAIINETSMDTIPGLLEFQLETKNKCDLTRTKFIVGDSVNTDDFICDRVLPICYKPKETEQLVVFDFNQVERKSGVSVVTRSFTEFVMEWNRKYEHIFGPNFDWSNMVVAGGSVLRCLLNKKYFPMEEEQYKNSDIDIFLTTKGLDITNIKQELNNVILRVLKQLAPVYGNDFLLSMSGEALSILPGNDKLPKIQIILRLYDDPVNVISFFDVDCCCWAYDGKHIYGNSRSIQAMAKGYNVFDASYYSPSYAHRLLKYAQRGIPLLIPQFTNKIRKEDLDIKYCASSKSFLGILLYMAFCLRPNQYDQHMLKKNLTAESNYQYFSDSLATRRFYNTMEEESFQVDVYDILNNQSYSDLKHSETKESDRVTFFRYQDFARYLTVDQEASFILSGLKDLSLYHQVILKNHLDIFEKPIGATGPPNPIENTPKPSENNLGDKILSKIRQMIDKTRNINSIPVLRMENYTIQRFIRCGLPINKFLEEFGCEVMLLTDFKVEFKPRCEQHENMENYYKDGYVPLPLEEVFHKNEAPRFTPPKPRSSPVHPLTTKFDVIDGVKYMLIPVE